MPMVLFFIKPSTVGVPVLNFMRLIGPMNIINVGDSLCQIGICKRVACRRIASPEPSVRTLKRISANGIVPLCGCLKVKNGKPWVGLVRGRHMSGMNANGRE